MTEKPNLIFNVAEPRIFPVNGHVDSGTQRLALLNDLNLNATSAEGAWLNPQQMLAVANYKGKTADEIIANQRRFCEKGLLDLGKNTHGQHPIEPFTARVSDHEVRGYVGINYGDVSARLGFASIKMGDSGHLYHQQVHSHPETPEALVLKATSGSGYIIMDGTTFEYPENETVFCQIPKGKEHGLSFRDGLTFDWKNFLDHKVHIKAPETDGKIPNTVSFAEFYPSTASFPFELVDPNFNTWNVFLTKEPTDVTVIPGQLTMAIPMDHDGIFHPYTLTANNEPYTHKVDESVLCATAIADPLRYFKRKA